MWEEAADCLPGMQQDLETMQEQSWCLRQQAEAFQATQAEHASSLIKLSAIQATVKVSCQNQLHQSKSNYDLWQTWKM